MPNSNALDRRELGIEAEAAAREYLVSCGLEILMENFRCRAGELDLVAIQGPTLVIVEVRLRTASRFGDAAESIGPRKRVRIARAARYLLLTHPGLRHLPVRFDVVTLDRAAAGEAPRLAWIRDAFRVGEG